MNEVVVDASRYRATPEYLRTLIGRAGLTQERAAELLGVHPVTMRRWLFHDRKVVPPYSAQVCLELLAEQAGQSAAQRQAKTTRPRTA